MEMTRSGGSILWIDTCSIHMPASLLGPNRKLVEQAQHTLDQIGRGLATMVVASGVCVVLPHGVMHVVHASQLAFYFGMIAFATFSCLKVTQASVDQWIGCDGKCHSGDTLAQTMTMSLAKKNANAIDSTSMATPAAPAAAANSTRIAPSNPRLPLLRKRVLQHLKQPFPMVNPVKGETRQRRHLSLFQSKIRVGKAMLRYMGPKKSKESDLYIVRVDCASAQDKHMNPVVMWDITATYDDFKKLEQQLKQELRAKQKQASTSSSSSSSSSSSTAAAAAAAALAAVKVPHLARGILFVQPSLTQHVLNARRDKLQLFINAIVQCQPLADLNAMRQFCQVL